MNLIHFSVAIAIFIFLSTLILMNYIRFLGLHTEALESTEASTKTFLTMKHFLSLGFPGNWNQDNVKQIGLLDYMYKKPVYVTEINGIDHGYTVLNMTIVFDEDCSLIALNNTVRVYEDEIEVPFILYNQTFCEDNRLNNATIILNSSFLANQSRLFFIYFSNDSNIFPANYSLPYSTTTSFNVSVYPIEKMLWLSINKLKMLHELDYLVAASATTHGNEFYLEVSE